MSWYCTLRMGRMGSLSDLSHCGLLQTVECRLLDILLETVHHCRKGNQQSCADVELIQLDGPLRVGSGPGEELFIGPLSRGGIDKNIYTKWEGLSFNCKGTWSSCERVIWYNRQTIYYRERQHNTFGPRGPVI